MVENMIIIPEEKERSEFIDEQENKLYGLWASSAVDMNVPFYSKEWKEQKSSAEYVVNWKTIRIERKLLMKWATIQKFELSIHKLISPKRDSKLSELLMAKTWTTYKLKVVYDEHKKKHSFLLETNDGYGNRDSRIISDGELDEVMSNFYKRFRELHDYKRKMEIEQRERMQRLASNDQEDADADLERAFRDLA